MAKSIRSIKADLRRDEALGECTIPARYLFILLITVADDHGRFRASPALLAGELYPYDDDVNRTTVAAWLDELEQAGRIQLWTVNGQRYGALTNWTKHQRIDNAARSELPPPPDTCGSSPQLAADRSEPPTVPPVDNFPAAGKEGKGEGDLFAPGPPVDNPTPVDNPEDEPKLTAVITELSRIKAERARPRSPTAWRAKVEAADRADLTADIRRLVARYPTAPATTLAAHLLGEPTPTLASHRKD